MSEGFDLPTNQLDNLAQRFGHENPDAPQEKLVDFLKETAKEWQALKERLANLRGAAEGAPATGDFAEADARLADAEEMQQAERTLAEVRKQAEVRQARGMAALIGGDGLVEAIRLFEVNLVRWSQADAPQDWAMTQNNFATALGDRANRTEGAAGAALLGWAVEAYDAALEVFTPEFGPYHTNTKSNLDAAREELAARETG